MLSQEQIHITDTFANTFEAFINRDGILLYMDCSNEDNQIRNSFFIYGEDKNKYYLGQVAFQAGSINFESFIDGEVIHFLKQKSWI